MSKFLEVNNLKTYFPIESNILKRTRRYVKAVDGVSFSVKKGETFGLVGESGCGKTTLGRTIIRLEEAYEGKVFLNGKDVLSLNKKEMKKFRKNIQFIFQDPYASLHPRMNVKQIIEDPINIHKIATGRDKTKRVLELLDSVALEPEHLYRYPHEFSGGQRQRIGIARALAVSPEVIICDEPVSALDVSIQAQVINLLEDLQDKFNLTYIFIAHDLSVVKHISDRVAVMYLGKIVEIADKEDLYNNPVHPYTKALLDAILIMDPDSDKQITPLGGDVPHPSDPPSGCRFHTRCSESKDICKIEEPSLIEISDGHKVACFL